MTPNHWAAVEWVFQNHRALFDQNVNRTCFQIVQLVLQEINDPDFGHVGKTTGEGQFRPAEWINVSALGSDGRTYVITGVSHDALKHRVTGQVIDILGRGNDSPEPIFDGLGQRMTALPQWSEVPMEYNRPNNPWVKAIIGTAQPQPTMPNYEDLGGDAYWRNEIGKTLQADMAMVGQTLNDGSSTWFSRPIFRILHAYANGQTPDRPAIITSVRNEWRKILGLPPVP